MIYQGFEVLEAQADGRLARVDAHERAMALIGAPTGRVEMDDVEGVSELIRDYTWTCLGPADVSALKAFVDARRGRAIPVWLPTMERDLELNGDFTAGHGFIDVETIGYTAHLFPWSGARRHLCLRAGPGGTPIYRKVTSAVNNLNGTESLYLDSALGASFPKDVTVVSFLRLCRMDDDAISISWVSRGYQTATLRFRELPLEAPL